MAARRLRIRAPQDFAAGVLLLGVAGFALWQGAGLAAGSWSQLGPGMLPRTLAILVGLLGIALVIEAALSDGERLERWSIRGPLLILGAAVAFGLTVRPFGLAVAGPLCMLIGAFASKETRWVEAIVFALVMTLFCLGLFKWALGLPIPVAPWALDY
jgi:putative tricarboxylic transport membrane protein